MDDKTRILVQLGASAAANCVPCFNHFYSKALEMGVVHSEIQEALEWGNQMKRGAQLAVETSINEIMEGKKRRHETCCISSNDSGGPKSSCCH